MSLESYPYLPVSTYFSSKTGVSISTAPCFLNTSATVSITFLLMAIWSGQKSLVPLGGLIQNLRSGFSSSTFSFSSFLFFCETFCTSVILYLFLSSISISSLAKGLPAILGLFQVVCILLFFYVFCMLLLRLRLYLLLRSKDISSLGIS